MPEMMASKRFIFGLISLHLMMGCTGGNDMCNAYVRGTCPPTWIQWGGKCYKATTDPLTWYEAKEECVKMESVLAAPQSKEENDFIRRLVPERFNIWINCKKKEGTWKCENGIGEVEFRNWADGEPNGYGYEDCVEVWETGGWTFGVIGNSWQYVKLQSLYAKTAGAS